MAGKRKTYELRPATVKDALFVGSEVRVGEITGIESWIFKFETVCPYCGDLFYPEFNYSFNEWSNCYATMPLKRKRTKEDKEKLYEESNLRCTKTTCRNGVEVGKAHLAFRECEKCHEIFPVHTSGTKTQRVSHSKFCNNCKGSKPEIPTLRSMKASITREVNKDVREKKAQREFERKRFLQGGSPGLGSGPIKNKSQRVLFEALWF